MLRFRTFRNSDPPAVVRLWRSRNGQPGLQQPVSVDLLEQLVFGKLYFDYSGMVLAFEDDRPVGFAHAGFGPNDANSGIATERGVVCLVLLHRDESRAEVATGLLEHCEAYLRARGTQVVFGGELSPIGPFIWDCMAAAKWRVCLIATPSRVNSLSPMVTCTTHGRF